jgi:predicted AlkP superfamily pyrophosphatase or phosphodiesterase
MYDPVYDDRFNMANPDGKWWDMAEPLWVTAENQGQSAATFFWPGSDTEIRGVRPSYYEQYDGSIPYEERVDTVLGWLMLEEPPTFITLYFDEPDSSGHSFGPDSPEVVTAVQRVDAMLGRLLQVSLHTALPFSPHMHSLPTVFS